MRRELKRQWHEVGWWCSRQMTYDNRIPRLDVEIWEGFEQFNHNKTSGSSMPANKLREREREPDDWHVLKTIWNLKFQSLKLSPARPVLESWNWQGLTGINFSNCSVMTRLVNWCQLSFMILHDVIGGEYKVSKLD